MTDPIPADVMEAARTLTVRLREALAEIDRHEHRHTHQAVPYWWRRASMAKLAERGLVEAFSPSLSKATAYRTTAKGRAVLAAVRKGDHQ